MQRDTLKRKGGFSAVPRKMMMGDFEGYGSLFQFEMIKEEQNRELEMEEKNRRRHEVEMDLFEEAWNRMMEEKNRRRHEVEKCRGMAIISSQEICRYSYGGLLYLAKLSKQTLGGGSSTRKEAQERQGKAVNRTSQTSGANYKEDHHKKTDVGERFCMERNLTFIWGGYVSRSSEDLQICRVDIHAGDENLLSKSFQQKHGIRDVITMMKILVPDDAADDPEAKLLVRMRPYGEGKDSWEHCTTPEGEVALPEEQPLYISQILRGRSSFPASATWVLETPEKCTPSSVLEAVLEIKLVTSGSMVQAMESNNTTTTLARLSIQVKGKEHNASTDVQLSRLAVKPENEQHDNTAEEKYQTEPMEK